MRQLDSILVSAQMNAGDVRGSFEFKVPKYNNAMTRFVLCTFSVADGLANGALDYQDIADGRGSVLP